MSPARSGAEASQASNSAGYSSSFISQNCRRAIKTITDAEKAMRWLWIKGVIHGPHKLLGHKPGLVKLLNNMKHPMTPGYITDVSKLH